MMLEEGGAPIVIIIQLFSSINISKSYMHKKSLTIEGSS